MKPQQILIGALLLSAAGLGAFLAFGGGKEGSNVLSGYIEGEPLYPASPVAGRLVALGVQRGDVVPTGAKFFSIDPAQTQAARDQALAESDAAKSLAADAQRGQRPAELGVIEAQLAAARVRDGAAHAGDQHLNLAADHVVQRRGCALVRNVHDIDSGHGLQQLAAKVGCRAGAG